LLLSSPANIVEQKLFSRRRLFLEMIERVDVSFVVYLRVNGFYHLTRRTAAMLVKLRTTVSGLKIFEEISTRSGA